MSDDFLPDRTDGQIELPDDPADRLQCLDCGKQVKIYDHWGECPFCESEAIIVEEGSA